MAQVVGYVLWFTFLLLAGWKLGGEIHAPIKPDIHPRHVVADK
jgi:membrane protein DedA with SNARE-associated domain